MSGSSPKKNKNDFLLEVGCEEIPADYLPAVFNWDGQGGLAAGAGASLSQEGVRWSQIQVLGTPRRIVLWVRGLEPVVRKERKGPPVSRAFDAQGKPTEAAAGFAKKWNVPLSRLKRVKSPSGEAQLVFEQEIPVDEILAQVIPASLQRIGFPKTMRWDSSGQRFARPVRWLLALYGAKVVPLSFGEVKAGRTTRGLRRLGDAAKPVSDVSSYLKTVSSLGIRLEHGRPVSRQEEGAPRSAERFKPIKRDLLFKELKAAARKAGGRLAFEEPDEKIWSEEFTWLLNTVTFLAEDPEVAVGSFRPEYLTLPPEVLATSMAKHLKLFSVFASDGATLLPKFLAVLEGKPADLSAVMANIDRIIEARFSDARFFYQEDLKEPLRDKLPKLSQVVFHEKLGNIAERVPRLTRLAQKVAEQAGFSCGRTSDFSDAGRQLQRAAELAKADLVTQMVREFPSLQGVIGGYYAKHDGEPEEVAKAVAEHYRPRTAGDSLPSTPVGAVVGLADRFDMLIGYFGAGMKPTGSVDPYALRRQALGLVRILAEFERDGSGRLFFRGLSIDRVLDEGIQLWGPKLAADPKTLKKDLRAFLRERFTWLLRLNSEIQPLIDAVLSAGDDDLSDVKERFDELAALWDLWRKGGSKPNADFVRAAKVAERTGRIVRAGKREDGLGQVNPEDLKESTERKLWESWRKVEPILEKQIRARQYAQAVVTYGSLYPDVHEFFEKVFVMDEDADVRRNRLAFLNDIHRSLADRFADLSKLPLAGVEPS